MPAPLTVPVDRPLTRRLDDAPTTWSTSQRTIIGLAADGVAYAAHRIAATSARSR